MGNNQLTVTELRIYPVKSCRGIALDSCAVDGKGFVNDRRWMFVDEKDTLISQRTLPEMAQIAVSLSENILRLEAPGMEALEVNGEAQSEEPCFAHIHDGGTYVLDCGRPAAEWFSRFAARNHGFAGKHGSGRLVVQAAEAYRRVDPVYSPDDHEVGFADGYPLHLVSVESVADLNLRTSSPVPFRNFRPNIVVAGLPAYDEDSWNEIGIGGIRFVMPKLCARCPMPQVDQETGTSGREPKATLLQYRVLQKGEPNEGNTVFGVNLIHLDKQGMLKVGDTGFVMTRQTPARLGAKLRGGE